MQAVAARRARGRLHPEVLVALGATAAQALLGSSFRVTKQRGVPLGGHRLRRRSSSRRSIRRPCSANETPPRGLVLRKVSFATFKSCAACSMPAEPDNAAIAAHLDEFAALLELSDAQWQGVRAYRRAAELIRGLSVPVAGARARGPRAAAARRRRRHRAAFARAGRDRRDRGADRAAPLDAGRARRVRALGRVECRARDEDRRGARAVDGRRAQGRRRSPVGCARCRESARTARRRSSRRSNSRSARGVPCCCRAHAS